MYFVYVLYSQNFKRFYKGYCRDLKQRLEEHNSGRVTSTKPFVPWKIIYFEFIEKIEDAVKREKYFKTAAGRRFLKNTL
jgi:putative endonuclease